MKKFDELADEQSIKKTVEGLKKRNVNPIVVNSGKEAHDKVVEIIPKGESVMNGSSRTLEQIGFIEHLKSGDHGWDNQHETVITEKDPSKQAELRKQALLSDYYLGSVHAVTEEGAYIVASNTGSQLPHIAYSSANVILVVGTQKIVSNLDEAVKRLEEYVVPLEEVNMQQKYGVSTNISKLLIVKNEHPMTGRKITMILVKEKLGF
ncbi:hypothetical protein A3G67_02630 [Candidatus Roizmanbacteria bacterium RIFCSPLOWO2_12_FULL_40_12]|uniref:LUD domain-containing protein n=1 Tax=Candidatus Roizmanbacteria bacterium RIFCSPLOWO2_01_FULL_40_42 TaxID=1802066 RepID=A0A1F7J627_9BACT|nr:MAG: hypothetical protein A2779_03920 [Candidatus Roizmanbacteria bacterium RIFCSPHIGHO2_01_FULL_40_98]OGK28647.1 MAG: hypothetical protein A3C31_01480 [Candidatus Roizmanbacteria bacterium RIFCSPHIGHO2_02_FULL_40_53]OGK29429.1 MAG: hypothetical protein A2W49_04250 [Candidatus Roizmanbacteria bacterium RIFCSPHIGHO2_12_41_18]OGK36631.1 MAG: hypothetical protein A3E69_00150 [Candidatus Roizmanbacteria bacterium RIFCSPHIGHO2_12_FULL_40_130]OGK51070.1 MAG: hypothetical protein A3B50_02805 [Candi